MLSSVPVDSPSPPHALPPPASLPAKAKIAETASSATLATLLLLPSGASGASDRIWQYRNGAWTGIKPPQSGWLWTWIAADPFNSNRWLLLGNGTTGTGAFPVTGNSVKATGTTVSPLWLTLNAGLTWQPITLTTPTTQAYTGAVIDQIEFDTTNEGVIAFSGRVNWSAGLDAAVWRGRFNAAGLAAFVSNVTWQDTFYSVPGSNGDLVVSEGDSPGLNTHGRLGYVTNNGTSIIQTGTKDYQYTLRIDRLPDHSHTIVGVDNGPGGPAANLWATADYRTITPTIRLANVGLRVAAGKNGIYVGNRGTNACGASDGVARVTNVLGTPVCTVVAAAGVTTSFIRSDRKTQTAIAALHRDGGGNQTTFYVTTDEANWTTISGPPGVQASVLSDSFEVLAPKKSLSNDHNATTGQCQCNAHKQGSNPVNTRSGAYWTRVTDLAVPTPGPALDWSRTYISQALTDTSGLMGLGWQHPYATHIITPTPEAGHVLIFSPEGNKWRYELQSDGSYTAFPGVYSQLVRGSGVFTLTLRDQQQWIFDASSGRLAAQRDAQGRALNLTYNGGGQLTVVADALSSSRALTITYNLGRINQVSDGQRAVHYGYDANSDLATIDDVMGRRTTYSYLTPPGGPPSHLLTRITDALSQTVETMGYDTTLALPRVITQTLQDGRAQAFSYLSSSTIITTTAPGSLPEVQQIVYAGDNTTAGMRLNGQAIWASSYDDSFSPSLAGDGNGNTTATAYMSNGLPIAQTDALSQTSQAAYDPVTNALLETVDPQGVRSRFLYDSYQNLISTTVGITTTSPLRATTLLSYQYLHAGVWNTTAAGATDSRLLTQTSPDGVVTRYAYGDARFPRMPTSVTVGYENGVFDTHAPDRDVITAYRYDQFGRVISTTAGLNTPVARTDLTGYNLDNTIAKTTQNYKAPGVFSAAQPDQNSITTYGYDKLGRTVAVTDTLGHVDLTHYNTRGLVDWTARNAAPALFDAGGLPIYHAYSRLVPDQNVNALYGYDGLGRSTFVTETGILTGTFNTSTLQFSDVTTRTTRTEYDTLSRPMTVTLNYRAGLPSTADMNVKLYTRYDGAGNVITQTDALGRWTVTEYDALNRPVKIIRNYQDGLPQTGPADADLVSFTQYDSAGRVARTVDNYLDGAFTATQPITDRITLLQYDQFSRGITTTLNYDPPTLGTRADTNRVSLMRYDPATMRLLGQRDPLGRWVSQQYDLLGRVVTTTQNCVGGAPPATCTGASTADQNVRTQVLYDGLGRTTLITDALSIVTQSTYDGLGRTTKTVQNYVKNGPTNTITNVTTLTRYDALGRTTILTDALGYPTRQTFDGLGQTVLLTDTMGRGTRMGYDGQGMLRWSKPPTGQVTLYQVDGLGRVTATIANYQDGVAGVGEPSAQDLITRTLYDVAGRRVRTIDAMNRVTALAYDNLDRLITVTENHVSGSCTWAPCDVQTQYQYDRAGNRSAIVDANNHVRRFSYDAADQQQQAIDALSHTTIYTYNQVGLLTQQQDPRGATNKLTFGYDNLNRLTSTTATNLGAITRAYDQLGRTKVLTDSSGTTNFSYDALSRMTRVTAPNTGSVTYGYSARGERSQLGYPNSGPTVQYAYWPDGQLRVVTDTTTLATYAYDTAGRLRQVARANNQLTTYHYDPAERLIESSTTVSDTVVGRFQYALNRLGLRTVVTETLALTPTLSTSWMETGSFEAGSLTDPTSGVDQVVGTVQLETAAPIKGAFSARVPNTSTSYLREDISSVDELFVSFYLRITAAPASNTRVFQISNRTGLSSFVTAANIQLTTSRRLRFRNDNTQIGLDSIQLALDTVYRVGVWQKKGSGANGVLAIYLAAGDAPFTSAFALSDTLSFTTPAARVNLGASTGTAANIVVDEFRLDRGAAAPIGPSLAALSTADTSSTDAAALPGAPPAFPSLAATGGAAIQSALGRLPLAFVPNAGQADAATRFVLRGMGGELAFGAGGLGMAMRPPTRPKPPTQAAATRAPGRSPPRQDIPRATLSLGYLGANATPAIRGALPLPGKTNYLLGNDRAQWHTNLPMYAGLVYGQLYDGIDLHYSGTDGQLKGTYVVARGADPTRIQWRYSGAQQVRVDTDGNLVVTLPAPASTLTDTEVLSSTLIERAPLAWQTIKEREVDVPVRYAVAADGTVSFALGAYDRTQPLIIDPTIVYSTFLGSGDYDEIGAGIAVDSAGNMYVAGNGGPPFVTKLNASGSAVVYQTYLSGPLFAIAVDSAGNAYLTGSTTSTTLPVTANALQSSCAQGNPSLCYLGDAFLVKLNASGSGYLYYSYLGSTGADQGRGIAVDSSGNAYITGGAGSGFPTTANAYPPAAAGTFVTKINPNLSGAASLIYSTILGGSTGEGIALDSANNVYVTGFAVAGLPIKNAVQASCASSPCQAAFVAKLNLTLTGTNSLIYSTYLGGSVWDYGRDIAVDASGSATVVGETLSTDMITTTGAFQPQHHGVYDAFVTRLNAAGTARVYSTYLGGSDEDYGWAVALDSAGNAYVTGYTDSTNFPTANAAQPAPGGGTEAFITALRADGHGLVYSTYLGGNDSDAAWAIAVDPRGSAYVTGQTYSAGFPLAYPVQQTYSGNNMTDAFVTKLSPTERVTRYTYDGLLRLIRAEETPGSAYVYDYDLAGNRISVQTNGGTPTTRTYNAADQITNAGYSYDLAGNLLTDGTATYTYDALNRAKTVAGAQSRTYTYNGDGVLVRQVAGGTTTDYTQDLAAPLSQILQTKVGATTTSSLYGLERLASRSGTPRTWYLADALGSVRRTLSDSGAPSGPLFYDPWGTPESGVVPTFGFTGELQDTAAGLVNLRARWYSTARGTFTSRDPFEGDPTQPYSEHPYQYAYSDPVLLTDPTGNNPYADPIGRVTPLEGVYIGAVIAMAFIAGNPADRRAEYPIPGASSTKRWRGNLRVNGYADLVDFALGEVYEVKTERTYRRSRTGILKQLERYIGGLEDAALRAPTDRDYRPAPATGIWKRGHTFPSAGTVTLGLWPYGIDSTYQPAISGYYIIKAKLAEDGIVVYWGEQISDRDARRVAPYYAPNAVLGFIDDTYQNRRKPDWGTNPPQLYPGLNVYNAGYWCATFLDALVWNLEELGRLGEQLDPVSSGGVPGIFGPGYMPVVP